MFGQCGGDSAGIGGGKGAVVGGDKRLFRLKISHLVLDLRSGTTQVREENSCQLGQCCLGFLQAYAKNARTAPISDTGDFAMAEIVLRNVCKRWGSFVGVDDFDLTIADREFLVLLGPSGCGKTTTMRMIAGLEDPTDGEILIGGKDVTHLDPKDRDVAMVFQSYALYPNMNVYENIRFPLKVRGIDPATHDEKVRRASAMVELDDFLHRKPAELSGGQRQRVALARAIVRQPNVFLMDEPLSNLDAKLRVSTRAQIKNLSHELAVTTST
jgi:ABC-type Fe3+/spermidine/putrescine transport system ATPase subunit